MPRYTFIINTTISLGCEVEAATLADAVAAAHEAPIRSLCHHCAASELDEWSVGGDLDGDAPSNCELVDFHTEEESSYEDALLLWSGEPPEPS